MAQHKNIFRSFLLHSWYTQGIVPTAAQFCDNILQVAGMSDWIDRLDVYDTLNYC